jgi:hypothetical protein
MDEVVAPINGVKHWLWRAVDGEEDPDLIRGIKSPTNGDTPDILVQTRRNADHPARTTLRTRVSTTGSRAVTGRPEDVRKSWDGSSPQTGTALPCHP